MMPGVLWLSLIFVSGHSCLDRLKMLAHYIGRDKALQVEYLSQSRQRQHQLFLKDGVFVDPLGQVVNMANSQLMVVTLDGHLISMNRPRNVIFHHSSLSAGSDVAMAGYVRIENGRLKHATNTSGHYQPPLSSFEKLLRFWESQGVSMKGVEVGFQVSITSSKSETFFYEIDAQNFLSLMAQGPQDPADLLQRIASSQLSDAYRSKAVAHLLLLGKNPTQDQIRLLHQEVAKQTPELIEDLESLSSSLDFKTILDSISFINNSSTRRLNSKFQEEMLWPTGSD